MSEPKKHYIDNDFGRTWVTSRFEARRGVHIPLSYIDINDGNLYDAVVFSQIMYWHEPSAETGKPRLKRWHDGYLWLVKNHSDWEAECRINRATIRKCLDRIKERQLIHYELHGEKGLVAPYIRINWETFEAKMKAWMSAHAADPHEDTPATTGQGVCSDVTGGLLPEVKSNTKTSKTTQRPTTVAPTGSTAGQSSAPVENRTAALRDYGNRVAEHIEALPPVSIDDFGKTDISEGYAVAPPPPRTEPLEEVKTALAELFGWKHEGVLQNYGRMLRGIVSKRKTAYDEYAFVGQPVSADELRAFVASWKRAHPGLDLPQTPDAMARHVSAYRAAQQAKPAAPVVNLPSQDELHAAALSYNPDEVL